MEYNFCCACRLCRNCRNCLSKLPTKYFRLNRVHNLLTSAITWALKLTLMLCLFSCLLSPGRSQVRTLSIFYDDFCVMFYIIKGFVNYFTLHKGRYINYVYYYHHQYQPKQHEQSAGANRYTEWRSTLERQLGVEPGHPSLWLTAHYSPGHSSGKTEPINNINDGTVKNG